NPAAQTLGTAAAPSAYLAPVRPLRSPDGDPPIRAGHRTPIPSPGPLGMAHPPGRAGAAHPAVGAGADPGAPRRPHPRDRGARDPHRPDPTALGGPAPGGRGGGVLRGPAGGGAVRPVDAHPSLRAGGA